MRPILSSSLFSNFQFASPSSWFELYAAISTFTTLLRTAINQFVPKPIQTFIVTKLHAFFFKSQPKHHHKVVSLKIDQWVVDGGRNVLYSAAQKYLPSRITQTYSLLRVAIPEGKTRNLELMMDETQQVVDEFEGSIFTWKWGAEAESEPSEIAFPMDGIKPKKQPLILTFDEKHRDFVMDSYIPHVLKTYEAMITQQKIVKFHSWDPNYSSWKPKDLSHPSTFETLALNPDLRKNIVDDIERFLKRKEFYNKVGKPWKRGYLLYGPPGTGKSSLIAALANYLKFDVYNLELTSVSSDQCLKRMMSSTPKRSIIVIEDIDCSNEVRARVAGKTLIKKVKPLKEVPRFSLSGMLNYMDGLGSGSGDEKIMIFTTNHKDKIDPALLRPGRMDMHINLSFLKGKAFRILASNYLDIQDHHHGLLGQIDELLEKIEVTPAVVAEQLIRHEDPGIALDELLGFLKEMEMKKGAEMPDDNPGL